MFRTSAPLHSTSPSLDASTPFRSFPLFPLFSLLTYSLLPLFPQHLPHLRSSTFCLTVVRCFRSFPLFSAFFIINLFIVHFLIVLLFHCSFLSLSQFSIVLHFVYSSDHFLAEVSSFSFRIPC